MAASTGRGSVIFKIIIVILIGVVIAAVEIPRRQWEQQDEEQKLCRKHLENVYYASLQYLKKYKAYPTNLDTLLAFMEVDSMLVPPGNFEIERLTVWESPRDSFLLGFQDLFHYKQIDWDYTSPESLSMVLVPKKRFKLVPQAIMNFYSDDSVFAERRQQGEKDVSIILWGKSRIKYEKVKRDSLKLPTKMFSVSEDPAEFRACPSNQQPYNIGTNVRPLFRGEILYTVKRTEDGNVAQSEFLRNLFVKKLRSDAAMTALGIIKADTAIFIHKQEAATKMVLGEIPPDTVKIADEDSSKIASLRDSLLNAMRDSIIINNINKSLSALKPKSTVLMEEEIPKIIDSKELEAWKDSTEIRDMLFTPLLSTSEKELAKMDKIQAMFTRLDARQKYYIVKTDTVGLTIACPIEGEYYKPDRSFFEKLFGVGPVKNHGEIENGDYSWEDKK